MPVTKINPYQLFPDRICNDSMTLLMRAASSARGPVWEVDEESEAWQQALARAKELCAKSVQFPPVAAGLPPQSPPATAVRNGPGDVVKIVLHRLNIDPGPNCGCEAMRQKMNAWGWRGCWLHRKEIHAWFAAKAKERGIGMTPAGLILLVASAAWNRR